MLIGQKNSVMNRHMVSAIVIIGKRQQDIYIIRSEDWINPCMYIVDAQDPYAGDTKVINKSDFKALRL